MKLMQQAMWFYKLATEQTEEEHHQSTKANYHSKIKTALQGTIDEVARVIREYQDQPFFNIQDFWGNYKWVQEGLDYAINTLKENAVHIPIIKQMIIFKAKHYLKNMSSIGVNHYLRWETAKEYLPPEIMAQFRKLLIIGLMRDLKDIKWTQERTQKELDNIKRNSILSQMQLLRDQLYKDLSRLKANSQLPSEFIDELGKRFGLDFWVGWQNQTGMDNRARIKDKEHLDVYEVAFIASAGDLNPTKLQNLINRTTEEGKRYLHGLLYATVPQSTEYLKDFQSQYFILDSENQPMNLEMQRIEWPPHFHGLRISQELRRIHEAKTQDTYRAILYKAQQLIADFGEIPQ